MGLTKPRASQIYNLDYKQATRVVTVTDINLSSGAPSLVDGVSLSVNDRVLVTGQSTASQNGLYDVVTVGSGSNGTWVRTSDANSTGEIDAGMIVMVTEGIVYADTQWKLITNNPITVGITALIFTQNYSANSISGGTSNVTVYSNSDVIISSAGTANVLTISSTGTVTLGTASITGNVTGANLLTTGQLSATGNITGNYIFGNGSQLSGLPALYSNANVTSLLASFGSNTISTTGTITAGNITGDYIFGNGSQLIGLPQSYTNSNVSTFLAAFGSNTISTTGTITAGNITGNYILGNGSQLMDLPAGSSISNGNSNIAITTADSNISMAINGVANTLVVSPGEVTIYGVYSNPKTITTNVVITENINSMLIGPVDVSPTGNIYIPDSSTLKVV